MCSERGLKFTAVLSPGNSMRVAVSSVLGVKPLLKIVCEAYPLPPNRPPNLR